jgi:hypothetical protein
MNETSFGRPVVAALAILDEVYSVFVHFIICLLQFMLVLSSLFIISMTDYGDCSGWLLCV